MTKSLAVLGNGITGSYVIKYLNSQGFTPVKPSKAEIMIVSPGIPPKNFPKTSAKIISELEWSFHEIKKKSPSTHIIAVSGTNGKSSVATCIAQLLKAPVLGNIGIPLIEALKDLKNIPPVIVVEVSSFQLETSSQFQADIVIMLNISPDHLDRHQTFQNYINEKFKLIKTQNKNQHLFYNQDDPIISKLAQKSLAIKHPFSSKIKYNYKTALLSQNVDIIIKIAQHFSIPESVLKLHLESFCALEHRIQVIKTCLPYTFINDSKATSPESTLAALNQCKKKPHLILCGKNKGIDYTYFIKKTKNKIKSLTIFGNLALELLPIFEKYQIKVFNCSTMELAITHIIKHACKNDIILFSPSAQSYDQFDNFIHRGNVFTQIVQSLKC